jgi:hypothetical protein
MTVFMYLCSLKIYTYSSKISISLNGTGSLDLWRRPFNASWLNAEMVSFWIESECSPDGIPFGCLVQQFSFNGASRMNITEDRWSARIQQAPQGLQKNIFGTFMGNSGNLFPHVSAEIRVPVTTGSPGSLLGMIQQEALNLSPEDPTCALTAAQDLEFAFQEHPIFQASFSTWDSSLFEV